MKKRDTTHTKAKASVRHLGCRLNQYEALAMEGRLKEAGFEMVPFGDQADLGIINTCTVTNEADAKSRNTIRRFIRSNPLATVVVVGCYSQVSANEVASIKGVDYIIGNHDKLNLLDYVKLGKTESPVIVRERISRDDFSIGFVGESAFAQRANLKIQDGCDFSCSFCIIPQARGRARSRSWSDLIEEAREMLQKGVREIVLTGVNLGTYRSDGHDFLSLIERLSALKGLDRLRISSIEPTTIPEELLALMAEPSHPLMPYLHVPMQSGTDKILKLMRRRYDLGEMKGFFMQAKQQIPDLCLGTDLMVGFPNENDDDFAQTCESFMEMPFS
ncbi:MAG: MiaB/RimO family radical SAM methylthiotransferase, partial [Verrucomicrobiota bacterium]